MSGEIQPYQTTPLAQNVDTFSAGLMKYLGQLGLPTETVLTPIEERRRLVDTLPTVVGSLTPQQCEAAMYISKFVAASAAGLFDAALNYLWDETVRNLRHKVAAFDLEYFFDSVITDPDRRAKFNDEKDLEKLDDWVLIKGCRETGIISDIGFRHLDYIRDMRNWASAAHPNQNELTGLQLTSWMETCIREVLGKDPEGLVIEVKKLLRSLREEKLDTADVPPIKVAITNLNADLVRSLLRTVFGMYTDPKLGSDVRNNIKLIAPTCWAVAPEEARRESGLKYAVFSANGEVQRAPLAREFLELVDGLSYLPKDTLAVEFTRAIETLEAAHHAMNNFYNEPPHARVLQKLVPRSGEVPDAVLHHYVKVLTLCHIGNGYGVSWAADAVYNDLIGRWQDQHVARFIALLGDSDIASRLQFKGCSMRFHAMAADLDKQATNEHVKRGLKFIGEFPHENLHRAATDKKFEDVLLAMGVK